MIFNQIVQLIFFRLHLILHAHIARFNVITTVALFGKFLETKHSQQPNQYTYTREEEGSLGGQGVN